VQTARRSFDALAPIIYSFLQRDLCGITYLPTWSLISADLISGKSGNSPDLNSGLNMKCQTWSIQKSLWIAHFNAIWFSNSLLRLRILKISRDLGINLYQENLLVRMWSMVIQRQYAVLIAMDAFSPVIPILDFSVQLGRKQCVTSSRSPPSYIIRSTKTKVFLCHWYWWPATTATALPFQW